MSKLRIQDSECECFSSPFDIIFSWTKKHENWFNNNGGSNYILEQPLCQGHEFWSQRESRFCTDIIDLYSSTVCCFSTHHSSPWCKRRHIRVVDWGIGTKPLYEAPAVLLYIMAAGNLPITNLLVSKKNPTDLKA